jgi:hypothetical protein
MLRVDVYTRIYISMLFLYMNGMLTTPNEIRNMSVQEYSALSVRSVLCLIGEFRMGVVAIPCSRKIIFSEF